MIIQTRSFRLALAATVARAFPIFLSGYIARFIFPLKLALKQRFSFIRRSSLAAILLQAPRLNHISLFFAARGFHEWRNVVIANALCREGDTIVDVGANIGTETLIFAKCVGNSGNVIAFEPLPENFLVLEHNVELNRLHNVKLHQAAVSDKEGNLHFLPPPDDWSIGEGRVAQEGGADREIEVRSVVLDAMFEAGELPAPRILAMDVEGHELSVLRGAEVMVNRCKPFIILEWNPELLAINHPAGELYRFLEEHSYKMWEISTFKLVPASPGKKELVNLLCIPEGNTPEGARTADFISRQLKKATFLPLIRGINPAIVDKSDN